MELTTEERKIIADLLRKISGISVDDIEKIILPIIHKLEVSATVDKSKQAS